MGFRFRKSIKLAPGIRMNVGKRGISMSAGVRGASVNLGGRGVHTNVGIPGTGISVRSKVGRSSRPTAGSRSTTTAAALSAADSVRVKLEMMDDGKVVIRDEDGNPLPPKLVKAMREQAGEQIHDWLEEQCEEWNKGIDKLLNTHLKTPPPSKQIVFRPKPFDVLSPAEPRERGLGLFGRLFQSRRDAIIRQNEDAQAAYEQAKSEWEDAKQSHKQAQAERKKFVEEERLSNPEAMQEFLAEVLSKMSWPRETLASLEVEDNGKAAMLDVDLPEIEDMPTHQATVAAAGLKLNIKERTDTQRRKEYMTHVHGIAFRLIGETFVALPSVEKVAVSCFSQRPDKTTGRVSDEYLLSVRVQRSDWEKIDFSNLSALDLAACLGSFDIERKMTKTGVFAGITPFAAIN